MPSLKACRQGSRAPTHLQLCHCPTGAGLRELDHALVADLVVFEVEARELRHCPTGAGLRELDHALVTDLIGS